jgi:hypothetical protein
MWQPGPDEIIKQLRQRISDVRKMRDDARMRFQSNWWAYGRNYRISHAGRHTKFAFEAADNQRTYQIHADEERLCELLELLGRSEEI